MPKRKSRTARKNKTKVQKSVAKKSITTFKASGEPNVEDVLNHAAVARNEDMEMDSAMDASASQLEILQVPQSCLSGGSLPSEPSHRTGPKKVPKKGKKVVEKSDERIHIECNELGQPIGPDSVHYSSYLGAVARVVGPITVSTWHKVPQHLKEKMWTMVKKKFIVSEQAKKLALKTLGKCWREYKGKLRKNFYDIHENDEERIANCPRHVKPAEWKIFVANTSKPDYKEQRIKLKKTREHHSLPHTCSRKGYARLGDEMKRNSDDPSSITRGDVWAMAHRKKNGEPINDLVKEKIDKLTETSSSIPYGKDDKLSLVLGTDPNGRVRGMGFGVTQSTLFCVQQNYARLHELEDELRGLRQKMSSMEAKLVKLESQQNESVNELHVEVLEEDRNLTVQNNKM